MYESYYRKDCLSSSLLCLQHINSLFYIIIAFIVLIVLCLQLLTSQKYGGLYNMTNFKETITIVDVF